MKALAIVTDLAETLFSQGVPVGKIGRTISETTKIPLRTVHGVLAAKYKLKRFKWSLEVIEKVKLLSREHSYAEIAEMIGTTPDAIKTKMNRIGFQKPMNAAYVPPSEVQRVIRLFREEGLSVPEISKKTGRTYDSVHYILRSRGFQNLNRERDDGKTGEMLAKDFVLKNGWTIIDASRKKPYDFLVAKNGKTLAVNVKSGQHFVEPFKNFKRLVKVKYPSALLYVTPGNPPKFYLLRIVEMEK